jgi:hypothetical protein
LIENEYLTDYQWDRETKDCSFVYGKTLDRMRIPKNPVPKEPAPLKPVPSPEEQHPKQVEPNLRRGVVREDIAEQTLHQQEEKRAVLRSEQLQTLFNLLRQKTAKLKEVITYYYDQEGFDYVFWNIRYANAKANKTYSTYLKKALECNWAYDWREEQEAIAQQAKRQQQQFQEQQSQEQEKQSQEQQLEKDRAAFSLKHLELPRQVKHRLFQQAESETPHDQVRRDMNVKMRYVNLVLEYLNEKGENFSQEVINLLPFITQIAAEAKLS